MKKTTTRTFLATSLILSTVGINHVMAVSGDVPKMETAISPDYENRATNFESNNDLSEVEDFTFYYGEGSPAIVDKIKQKDLVVIEPRAMQQQYIEEAKNSGTYVYGYISMMNVANWNQEKMSKVNKEDFYYHSNGERHFFPEWDAYLMDISSKHYQDVMLDGIEELVVDKGLDGVFFDVMGSESGFYEDKEKLKRQQKAMQQFMSRVKERFPEISIGQNKAIDTLKEYTAPFVDFVLWEDFTASAMAGDENFTQKINQLNEIQEEYEMDVFAISFADRNKSEKLAIDNGFHILHNPNGSYYNKWIAEDPDGEVIDSQEDTVSSPKEVSSDTESTPKLAESEKPVKPVVLEETISQQTGNENQNPIADVESYKFYYGPGNESIVENMKNYDLMIVEPLSMEENYIQETQNSGTEVYGYISAMEVASWNTGLTNELQEQAYFHDENGNRQHFAQWDSYLMDITNQHYQNVMLDEIEQQIVNKGLDGVFLDTVGDVEVYHQDRPEIMKEQQQGMKEFMARIQQRFPGLSIGQNFGFDTLENYTAPYVDFFVWENFSDPDIRGNQWYQNRIEQLNQVQAEHGVEILTVSYEDEKETRKIAERNGFKLSHNPGGSIYNQW